MCRFVPNFFLEQEAYVAGFILAHPPGFFVLVRQNSGVLSRLPTAHSAAGRAGAAAADHGHAPLLLAASFGRPLTFSARERREGHEAAFKKIAFKQVARSTGAFFFFLFFLILFFFSFFCVIFLFLFFFVFFPTVTCGA